MPSTPKRTLGIYKQYNFIDKDPCIDYCRGFVYRMGGPGKVADQSGVSYGTLNAWFNGKTRKPQFATVARVLMTCGEYQLDLRKVLRNGKG